MYGGSSMETYITMCNTDSQWEFAVWLGNSNRGSGLTQRGGLGGGREVQEGWDVCMLMADSC